MHHVSEGLRPGVACGEGLVGTISRQNQVSHGDRHRLGWGDGSVGEVSALQASKTCVCIPEPTEKGKASWCLLVILAL